MRYDQVTARVAFRGRTDHPTQRFERLLAARISREPWWPLAAAAVAAAGAGMAFVWMVARVAL